MNCPKCKAGSNDHGVYKGGSVIHCTSCGMDWDFNTGEILYTGTSLEKGSRRREQYSVLQEDNGDLD